MLKTINIIFIFLITGCSTPTGSNTNHIDREGLELVQGDNGQIIDHYAYTLSYNEEYEQANWVAYELTKEELIAVVERKDNFIEDPLCEYGSATDEDYKGSGFDRGHLAPAADMLWSETAMKESFYYSNMSPQHPSFNRGIWKQLETQVRNLVEEYDTLYIATGGIFTEDMETIGSNEVAIPKSYYKVILNLSNNSSVGYIIPNEKASNPLDSFVVSVDYVEQVTGLDFFYKLPDDIEVEIEK